MTQRLLFKTLRHFQSAIERRWKKFKESLKIEVIIAVAALCFTGYQAILLRTQVELEVRPFVSIDKVSWWYKSDTVWFGSSFVRENHGARPAADFGFRNFRAIIFDIRDSEIAEKVKLRTSEGQLQYLEEYVADERNKLILNLLEVLGNYFSRHPDATKVETEAFLKGLTVKSQEIRDKPILFYEGGLLYSPLEVNNDMDEYRKRQKVVIVPNREEPDGLGQQMGQGYVKAIIDGNNLLVVYWAFQYMDIQKNKRYSSFYLGYADRNFSVPMGQTRDGKLRYLMQTFQSWPSDEPPLLKKLLDKSLSSFTEN